MAEKKRRDDITPREDESVGDIARRNEDYERGRRDEAAYRERRAEEPPRDYSERRRGGNWWPIFLILLLLLLLLGGWYFLRRYQPNVINNVNQNQQNQNQQTSQDFQNEQKTSNFQRSIPVHKDVIPAPPPTVLIQTTSVSAPQNSTINITLNNQDYGTGNVTIGSNGFTMQRSMDPNAPDGTYTVNYKTCGADGNCQSGNFQFKVDRTNTSGFDDQKNKNAAEITIANGKIYPDAILVSRGTRITIINNTQSTYTLSGGLAGVRGYFTSLSGTLSPDGTFSFTFNQPGYFPYNLVSGNSTLNGRIVVQ